MLERQASKVRERCRDTAVTAANPSCPPKTPMLRDGWEDENHWKWQKCWDFLCGLTVCCWLQKTFCLNLYKASILEAALTQTMDRFDMIWFCTYVLKNKKMSNRNFKSPSHWDQVGSALCKMYSCAALQQLEEVQESNGVNRSVHFTTMVIPVRLKGTGYWRILCGMLMFIKAWDIPSMLVCWQL